MAVVFKNNAKTTLASGITSSATSITVADGSVFPTLTGSDTFFCTLDDGTNIEIVEVTAISSNTLTATRAQDNTSATSFSTGTVAELRLTAGILNLFSQTGSDINAEVEAYLDANGLTLPDSVKAQFGDDNDLQIFHNGTKSVIQNAVGDLEINNNADDSDILFKSDNGSGGLTTYFMLDGGLGYSRAIKNIRFDDNVKATFGSSNDLQIYHTGSNSVITDTGSGDLKIRANNLLLEAYATEDDYLTAIDGGAVTIFYDGSPKLATTSTGIDVTGNITVGDSHTIGDDVNDNLEIASSTGENILINSANQVYLQTGGITKLETNASGISVTGTINSGAITSTGDLELSKNDPVITLNDSGTSSSITGQSGNILYKTSSTNRDHIFYGVNNEKFRLTGDGLLQVGSSQTTILDASRNLTNIGTITSSGAANIDGAVQVGDTVAQNSFGLLQVNQEANNDESGIGLLSSGHTRSMRIWVDESNSYINSGNGGSANIVLNEAITVSSGGNLTGVGTISSGNITTENVHLERYQDGTVSSNVGRVQLIIDGKTGWATGDELGSIDWYTVDGSGIGQRNVARIVGVNNQGNGSTTTAHEGELEFYTSAYNTAIGSTPVLRLDGNQNATFAGTISSGAITVTGDVMPVAENAHNIGSASVRWEDLYVDDGFIRNAYIDEYIYHNSDTDTNLRFQTDRATLTSGGGASVDAHSNGNLYLTGTTVQVYGNYNSTGTISSGAISTSANLDMNANSIIDIEQLNGTGGSGWLDFNMDTDNIYPTGTTDNITVLGSITHHVFVGDSNGNGTGGNFYWGYGVNNADSGTFTETMELDRSGNLTVTGEVEATALDINGNGNISGNLTLGGYLAGPATFTIDPAAVGDNTGTVVIAGNLQVDGTTTTVNSTTVNVSDKAITLGYDATTDAANNLAGIVVYRPETSNAQFLWNETNERFEINRRLNISRHLTVDASGTNDTMVEIGSGTASNHYAYIDLIGDATYTDYGLRIIRNNSGANTTSVIYHRGTGDFVLETQEAANLKLRTSGANALTIGTTLIDMELPLDMNDSYITGVNSYRNVNGTEIIDSNNVSYTIVKSYAGATRLWLGESATYLNNTNYYFRDASSNHLLTLNTNGLNIRTAAGGLLIEGTQVITGSRNLTNIGTISSGSITVDPSGTYGDGITINAGDDSTASQSAKQIIMAFGGTSPIDYAHSIRTRHNSSADTGNTVEVYLWDYGTDSSTTIGTKRALVLENSTGLDLLTGGYKVGGTTVIDSSRNLTNIGTINSGAITIDVDNVANGALRIEANQTNPDNDFYFAQEIISTLSGTTATTGDREQGGIYMDINSTATGGDTSNEHRAYGVHIDLDSTGDADLIYGVYSSAVATPTTGTTTNVYGGFFHAEDNGGAGNVGTILGVQGSAASDNATSDTNAMYAGYFKAYNVADSATITTATAVYGELEIASGSADIYGTSYVFRAEYDNNGTVSQTNTTYLYYGNYAGVLPTNAYGVYIVDAVDNYFAGAINSGANFQISGTTVIDSSRNLTNIGTISIGTDSGDPFNAQSVIKIQDGGNAYVQVKAGTAAAGGFLVGDTDDDFVGGLIYSNSTNSLTLTSGNVVALTLDSSQNATFAGRVTTGEDLRFSGTPRIRADNEINFLTIAGGAQTGKFLSVTAQTAYSGNSASSGMFNALNGYAVGTGNGTTVIDSSRNLTNIGTISTSGNVDAGGRVKATNWIELESSGAALTSEEAGLRWDYNDSVLWYFYKDNANDGALHIQSAATSGEGDGTPRVRFHRTARETYFGGAIGVNKYSVGSGLNLDVAGAIGISGTTVIDSSRNLTNIGTINSSNIVVTTSSVGGVGLEIRRSSSTGRAQLTIADESGGDLWRIGATGPGSTDFAFFDGGANVLTLESSTNKATFAGTIDSGNIYADYSLLGRGFRSANRGELHLNATGATDVAEIFFGYGDGYTDANIRWGISDRGSADDRLIIYRGPYHTGFTEVAWFDASERMVSSYNGYSVNGTTVIDSSRNLTNIASITTSGSIDLTGLNDTTDGADIHLPRGSHITFYGNNANNHSIGSRSNTGAITDDLRISSYGAIYFDLDSNSNNSSAADFVIGRHGGGTGTISNLFSVSGETGAVISNNNITAYGSASDIRLKENIEVIQNPIDKVQKLRGVTFNYKKDGSKSTGLIAQELEEVLPEVVYETHDLHDEKDKFKAVRYGNIVGLLVEAIKEQQKDIEYMKSEIKTLKEKNNGN